MDPYRVLAFLAGSLVVISALPQIITLIKHKSAKDISLPMFFALFTANIMWFVYGLHIKDAPIIYTNIFAGAVSLTNILLIIRYRYGQG